MSDLDSIIDKLENKKDIDANSLERVIDSYIAQKGLPERGTNTQKTTSNKLEYTDIIQLDRDPIVPRVFEIDVDAYLKEYPYKERAIDKYLEAKVNNVGRNSPYLHVYGPIKSGKSMALLNIASKQKDVIFITVPGVMLINVFEDYIKEHATKETLVFIDQAENIIYYDENFLEEASKYCRGIITCTRQINNLDAIPMKYFKIDYPFTFENLKIPRVSYAEWCKAITFASGMAAQDIIESIEQVKTGSRSDSKILTAFINSYLFDGSIYKINLDGKIKFIVNSSRFKDNKNMLELFKLIDMSNMTNRTVKISNGIINLYSFTNNETIKVPFGVLSSEEDTNELIKKILK